MSDRTDHSESVQSIESICSDGCPVSPSILYDQRARMIETRKYQNYRNAITAYRTRKSPSIVGKGAFVWLQIPQSDVNSIGNRPREKSKTEKYRYHLTQTFYRQRNQQNQEMISICI